MRELTVHRQNNAEDKQVLRRCKSDDARCDLTSAEKSSARTTGIVEAVLDAEDGRQWLVGNAVFERAGHRFDGLREPSPTSVAVPSDFGAEGRAPMLADCPMRR